MKKIFRSNIWLILFIVFITVSLACGGTTPTSTISTATSVPGVVQPTSKPGVVQPTSNPVAATATQVPPTQIPATPTTAPKYYLGDTVQNSGYVLTALTVADPATPGMLYSPETGKKLVAVEIIIGNVSGDVLSSNPLNAILIDDGGFVYQEDIGSVDGEIASLSLNPGEQTKGWVSFKIPDTAKAAGIKYSSDILGTNVLQSPLTPPPSGHTPVIVTITPSLPASKLGDVVEQSGYSLSASKVEDPTTPAMFYTAKSGYKLIGVQIVLTNVSGADKFSSNPMYAYLVDSNGFVYSDELMGRDGQIDSLDLSTGEKAQGWVSFTLPEKATPAYIKYEIQGFSGQFLIAGLTK
jgi:hypothetical protein